MTLGRASGQTCSYAAESPPCGWYIRAHQWGMMLKGVLFVQVRYESLSFQG